MLIGKIPGLSVVPGRFIFIFYFLFFQYLFLFIYFIFLEFQKLTMGRYLF